RDQQPLHAFFIGDAHKDSIDLAAGRGSQNVDRAADRRSRSLRVFDEQLVTRGFGIAEEAKCDACGSNSCNIPSCLPTSSLIKEFIPVTLPPGRLRLATRPC